jgi:hypothetical protein
MTSRLSIPVLILLILSSCGPGQQGSLIEEAEKNAFNDSIKRNAEMRLLQETESTIMDSLTKIEQEIALTEKSIGKAKADYEIQLDKLAKIKKFKLFRNKAERETQIREQSDVLYKHEKLKSELEYKLVNLQVKLDYYNTQLREVREK